ncbi:hypothetical protein J3A83DRAFT_4185607 [Scleroderma citrinum]
MDELAEARVELDRLESKRQEVFSQLLDIHTATEAQRTKIDELIRKRSPPINRIPSELLVRILNLASVGAASNQDYFGYRSQKRNLISVCRRWKDVILGSPSMWTQVLVCPAADLSSLRSQLRRTSEMELDIIIGTWQSHNDLHDLWTQLNVIIPFANRWRSLIINRCSTPFSTLVFDTIKHIQFPSLNRVCIPDLTPWAVGYPAFLLPENAPALQHAELGEFVVQNDFSIATTLQTLELRFKESIAAHASSPLFLPTQSLTMLSLTGNTNLWLLLPNSIHIPFLRTLVLDISEPVQFMDAIEVPKLEHFYYSSKHVQTSVFFNKLRGKNSKFSSVRHLSLTLSSSTADIFHAMAFCPIFPGARHVELQADSITAIFLPHSSSRWQSLVDEWDDLERLTIHGISPKLLRLRGPNGLDPLVHWLRARQEQERKRLFVKLMEIKQLDVDLELRFSGLYDALQEYCVLELEGVPLTTHMTLSMTPGSPLWLVNNSSAQSIRHD